MSRPHSVQSLQSSASAASSRPPLAQLFVTNLRLLDLDRLPDWPSITPRSFSTKDTQQNQKQRIRCVEWALYRLFELWDPDETREKLQPFFPPLEPLQSLNLRAALFRCLDQLKKNGVLGRECMLRKTMLDECKGEKLMEVLLLFSTAVLRRAVALQQNGEHQPISMRLAASPLLSAAQQGSLLPLSFALRANLSRLIRLKAEKRARCVKFGELLGHKDQQLHERMVACQKSNHSDLLPAEQAAITNQLRVNWPGSSKWTDVVLHGDEVNPGDMPLKQPFNEVWNVIANGGSLHAEAGDSGLLANLEHRVRLQKERLAQWQTFHEKIASTMSPSPIFVPRSNVNTAMGGVTFHFDKHQSLRPSRGGAAGTIEPPSQDINPTVSTPYGEIVKKMKNDIAEASKAKAKANKREGSARKASTSIKEFEEQRAPTSVQHAPIGPGSETRKRDVSSSISPHGRVQSQLRSSGSNAVSERSTSVSSMFSPAKPREPSEQPGSPVDISITDVLGLDKLKMESTPDATPAASAAIPATPGKPFKSPEVVKINGPVDDENAADAIVTSVLNAAPTPIRPIPLSLTERARQSLANIKPRISQSPLREELTASPELTEPESPEAFDRRASLLDRTRQSMSRLPAQPGVRSKKPITKKSRPSSMIYPINQFETPGRPRDVPIRNSTPTEKLFSPDAEYASVFKSRPRVPLSPVFSPDDSTLPTIESNSELDDSLDNVLSNSSPLAARIFSAEAN